MESQTIAEERLIGEALACGARKAAVIPGDRIVLSPTFRDLCAANSCGNFGRFWVCPPDVGDIETLMAQVRAWPRALLYQTVAKLQDSFDFEGMMAAGRAHQALSQRLGERLRPRLPGGFLHLTCGGCHLCEACTKGEGLPCRYPYRALSSLEAYGIDVYGTAKGTDLQYINGPDTVTYFGLLCFHGARDA
ncbi:MAG: DUF2284 domain-containing protein [Christensenellales bacterium]